MALWMLPEQAAGRGRGAGRERHARRGRQGRNLQGGAGGWFMLGMVACSQQGQMLGPKETGQRAWRGGGGDNGTCKKVM